ncbi:MAG: hypothetical protein JRG91_02360, partial [Deltaproteobacteria bacterium]|nr:hypothetical protein [Deltaproteobacteria bacterium]
MLRGCTLLACLAAIGLASCAQSTRPTLDGSADPASETGDAADAADALPADADCPPGLTDCGGTCVDTSSDHGNCGACGNACDDEEVCEDGVCSDCVPVSDTESCNGIDDNCNGETDEGFPCRMGEETTCTTTCGSEGSGMCGLDCEIPDPDSCVPPVETCNGADDDCDDACDDGFDCCRGGLLECTTTCGTTGSMTCSPTCTLGACVPPAETCNGIDDDCNDGCDEGFDCCAGDPGSCTTTCGSTGTTTCTTSCDWTGTCAPPAETCNGSDDDCDTVPDDTTGCTVPVYRFWCPGDHLYKNDAVTPSGCTLEGGGGPVWYNYATAVSGSSFSTTEFFKLYNSSSTDHFYCRGTSERDYAISIG